MKRFLGVMATLLTIGIFGILMILNQDDATLFAWLGVATLAIVYVGLTSVYIIPADKMLAMFLVESYLSTYLPSAFANTTDRNGRLMIDYPMARRGIGGSNIVVGLWPFWHGVYLPLTAIELRVHASRVYTKDVYSTKKGMSSPSLPIQAKVTVVILLAPDLRDFFHTFNVLGKGVDLAADCVIHDNMWHPNQEDKQAHAYEGPVIASILLRKLESVILEATRKTGSQFPWRGKGNVTENKQLWEEAERLELADPHSLFSRGGILRRQRHAVTGVITAEEGNAVREVDLNTEDIEVEDADARKALGRPMIETLEAEAQEAKGRGEGLRIHEKATKSKVTPEEILRAEAAEKIETFNLNQVGDDLVNTVGKAIGNALGNKKP